MCTCLVEGGVAAAAASRLGTANDGLGCCIHASSSGTTPWKSVPVPFTKHCSATRYKRIL